MGSLAFGGRYREQVYEENEPQKRKERQAAQKDIRSRRREIARLQELDRADLASYLSRCVDVYDREYSQDNEEEEDPNTTASSNGEGPAGSSGAAAVVPTPPKGDNVQHVGGSVSQAVEVVVEPMMGSKDAAVDSPSDAEEIDSSSQVAEEEEGVPPQPDLSSYIRARCVSLTRLGGPPGCNFLGRRSLLQLPAPLRFDSLGSIIKCVFDKMCDCCCCCCCLTPRSFEATCEKFVPQRVVTFMDVVPDDEFDLANEHADISGGGGGGGGNNDDDDSVFSR